MSVHPAASLRAAGPVGHPDFISLRCSDLPFSDKLNGSPL